MNVATAAMRISLEKAHVLLVESTPLGMEIAKQIVSGFGVRTPARAASAAEAMRVCEGPALDLILCEPALPGVDGYDFVRQLRRSRLEPNAFAPVVLISAHTPRSQVVAARDCGANFLVVKPLSARVLLERILWIARENRPFIECDAYVGPDRRFQSLGPPPGVGGRRKDDPPTAGDPALGQAEIDEMMNPRGAR